MNSLPVESLLKAYDIADGASPLDASILFPQHSLLQVCHMCSVQDGLSTSSVIF